MDNKLLVGLIWMLSAWAIASGEAVAEGTKSVPHPGVYSVITQDRQLDAVLHEVGSASGVHFVWPPELGHDLLAGRYSANTWYDLARQFLAGYNYVATAGEDGRLREVIITGRAKDGPPRSLLSSIANAEAPLFSSETAPAELPEALRQLPPGTVKPIRLDRSRLTSLPLGKRLTLRLPGGEYEVVHDNRYTHENGDLTWVGYLDNEGKEYRVMITLGTDGTIGQILTPDGLYRIEFANGRSWLVDVTAAGLMQHSMEGDERLGGAAVPPQRLDTRSSAGQRALSAAISTGTKTTGTQTANGANRVDLMMFYTVGMVAKPVTTRVNNLIALANQAYTDSKVSIALRLVYAKQVAYTENNDNSVALDDLTYQRGPFANLESLRKQYGGDLVSLIRPFKVNAQMSCGVAWVGGAYGSALTRGSGFSVISDGIDGMYYCTNYTLAHELGHNMGSAHDKAHSSFPGKYPFSYGYGKQGMYGTIMSYFDPVVGIFSTPDTSVSAKFCKGLPCGVANQADNARSLNLTASTVSAFLPATR